MTRALPPGTAPSRAMIALAVTVAALGNFVDTYDLLLFSVVRVASLRDLGLSGAALTSDGLLLLNLQMFGMLVGGITWGVLGDKRGRLSVLFGSIIVYSLANLANAYVTSFPAYAAMRLVAGIGLAGELGAGITLVAEILPREKRGYGTMAVAAVGLLGAGAAVLVSRQVGWRNCYLIGGLGGLFLLVLRAGVRESSMFARLRSAAVEHGNFLLLFRTRRRLLRYLACIAVGLPIWYVTGILVTLAPEFGRALHLRGELLAGSAVLLSYCGGTLGDVLSSLLSQVTHSRKQALFTFLLIYGGSAAVCHFLTGVQASSFVWMYLLLGIGSGFWVTLLTVGAEQFGTNIRATVATTVPNFVRAMAIPITGGFALLSPRAGFLGASAVVGVVCFGISLLAASQLRETFGEDLDYPEEDAAPPLQRPHTEESCASS